jgi:heptosyltransferase-2
MLCSLPLYAAVKKKYPASTITLVASQTNYPVPFREINPYIDEVFIYDKSSIWNIIRFFIRLRKKKYLYGIVPSTIKFSSTSHIINFLSGARNRVGVRSIDGIKNPVVYLLNIKKDFYWDRDHVHQSERNMDIARLAGFDLSEEEQEIKFRFSAEDSDDADNFIKQNFPGKKIIIGFHPGAGKEASRWEENNFIELISELYKKFNNYVLFTCGKLDKEVVGRIVNELSLHGIPSVIENLPLLKLAAVLDKINLYVTNDTGTMHIAGKTRVNQISLFGPMQAYEWAPTGENKFYLRSDSGDINRIEIKDVLALCTKILEE